MIKAPVVSDEKRPLTVGSKTIPDPATMAGLFAGLGAVVVSFLMEGGELDSLLNVPAAIIVFGGTLGATMLASPARNVFGLPRLLLRAFMPRAMNERTVIDVLANLAEIARRDGLLALESTSEGLGDPFLRRGIDLVVDGGEPETVREVLDLQIEQMEARHGAGYGVLEAMGGFAPTMGIIGTVMGLVHVLGSLDDPSSLGPAIATAFIATLYGVASANLLWLPLATKLRHQSERESTLRRLMTHGVLAIQAGENPRVVREKLTSFLPPTRTAPQKAAQAEAKGREAA